MNKALQLACYAITFLFAFWVGSFLVWFIPEYARMAADKMPGKPLPEATLFLLKDQFSVPYLIFYPWLIFVDLPLFARKSYWDETSFLLRFSVLLSTDLFLFAFFLIAFLSPVIGMTGMPDSTIPLTWFEAWAEGVFWFTVVLILGAAVYRVFRR